MLVQSDGRLLVGGSFTQIGGQAYTRIARLRVDGRIDSSFLPLVVDNAVRLGRTVKLRHVKGQAQVRLRPAAVTRALENLVGNAVRHGTRAEVSLAVDEQTIRIVVEDDGPGIPVARRDGGALKLGQSEALGGLRAELVLAR